MVLSTDTPTETLTQATTLTSTSMSNSTVDAQTITWVLLRLPFWADVFSPGWEGQRKSNLIKTPKIEEEAHNNLVTVTVPASVILKQCCE
jgi:hypothetical protein